MSKTMRKPNRFDYDSKLGIYAHLGDLKNFNLLLKKRHNAGYVRHEKLLQWVVMGRWFLDSCGNCMKATSEFVPADHFPCPPVVDSIAFHRLVEEYDKKTNPNVLTQEDIEQRNGNWNDPRFKDRPCPTSVSYEMPCWIPITSSICPVCKYKFLLVNCHDVHMKDTREIMKVDNYAGMTLKEFRRRIIRHKKGVICRMHQDDFLRNDRYIDLRTNPKYSSLKINQNGWVGKGEGIDRDNYVIQPGDEISIYTFSFYHGECWKELQAKNEEAFFSEIFEKAGFTDFKLTEIPNEYCGKPGCCPPWYDITFKYGGIFTGRIKIGWRKRVINIDVELLRSRGECISLSSLFPNEDVTKANNYIHAWGKEKCIEYLTAIRNKLEENHREVSCQIGFAN